jgi:hypothetical protein
MDGRVVGWKLDAAEREVLLEAFPPRYAETDADHVTLWSDPERTRPLPTAIAGEIVGEADDGQGVQALVVSIRGGTERPDGGRYHVTWSLAPGRRAKESNDVIARLGWRPLAEPRPISLRPARF